MWRNPRFPTPEAQTQAPPAEQGQRLASFDRGNGQELRLNLDEFNGSAYLSLRVWHNGWPLKGKGVSIRLSEVTALIDALAEVEAWLERGGG